MNSILAHLGIPLIGPISGIIAMRLMDYVDDVQKWTEKLPDWAKQLLVVVLATEIPLLNAQFGLSLPIDQAGLLTQPSIQAVVSVAVAFILKGHQSKS